MLFLFEFPIPQYGGYGESIAIGCYIVIFALFESLAFFVWLYLLNFLLPKDWEELKKVGVLGLLYLQVVLIALTGQLFSIVPTNFDFLQSLLVFFPRPYGLQVAVMGVIGLVNAGIAFGLILLTNKYEKVTVGINRFMESLSTLSVLYLLIDLAAFVYIVVRNV